MGKEARRQANLGTTCWRACRPLKTEKRKGRQVLGGCGTSGDMALGPLEVFLTGFCQVFQVVRNSTLKVKEMVTSMSS